MSEVKRYVIRHGCVDEGSYLLPGERAFVLAADHDRIVAGLQAENEESSRAAWNNFEAMQEITLYLLKHDALLINHDGDGQAAGKNVVDSIEMIRAERDTLRAEVERLQAMTAVTCGVGDGSGKLFVHGDYDSIKRVQAIIFEVERLRKDAERYRWLRRQRALAAWENSDGATFFARLAQDDEGVDAAMEASR